MAIFGLLIFYIILFSYLKLSKDSSTKYYQENKERLQKRKKARERPQNFSEEEEAKKLQYVCKN